MSAPLRINPNVSKIVPPTIDVFNKKVAKLQAQGEDVISLAQGVASFSPPRCAINAVRKELQEHYVNIYSPDAGLLQVRQRVVSSFQSKGLDLDAESELLLTAGASQAFFTALLTIASPGEKVILPTPYYFDHQYAVLACGCEVVEVPMVVSDGTWRFDVPAIIKAAQEGARALVLVTPNNPTGAVATKEDYAALAKGLAHTDVAIITDETYDRFTLHDDGAYQSAAAVPGLQERTIVVGSYSKSFAMAGWRIGYMAAPKAVIDEALKLQDSIVICAPVISQVALGAALSEEGDKAVEAGRQELIKRRAALRSALDSLPALKWREPKGAFFVFLELTGDKDDDKVAHALLDELKVATLPGSAFGEAGRGHLRLSFGNVGCDLLVEAGKRMAAFFTR